MSGRNISQSDSKDKSSPLRTPTVRRYMPALATVGITVSIAACGSSSHSSSAAAGSAGGQTSGRVSQQLRFNRCMRSRGVPISDTATTPAAALTAGAPASILQAAIAACRQYEQGAFSTITPQDRSRFTHAFLEYAICLRAHGVNVPDPSEAGGNGFGQKLLAAETAPNFKAANTACRRNLPAELAGARG
jgi:hypothetical protein